LQRDDLKKIFPQFNDICKNRLLRTNTVIYADLLALKYLESLSLGASPTYNVLYQLHILDSFVNEYQTKRSSEAKAYFSGPVTSSATSNYYSVSVSAYPILTDAYKVAALGSQHPEAPTPKVPIIGLMAPHPGHASSNNHASSVRRSRSIN
jgi:hypothetical protein